MSQLARHMQQALEQRICHSAAVSNTGSSYVSSAVWQLPVSSQALRVVQRGFNSRVQVLCADPVPALLQQRALPERQPCAAMPVSGLACNGTALAAMQVNSATSHHTAAHQNIPKALCICIARGRCIAAAAGKWADGSCRVRQHCPGFHTCAAGTDCTPPACCHASAQPPPDALPARPAQLVTIWAPAEQKAVASVHLCKCVPHSSLNSISRSVWERGAWGMSPSTCMICQVQGFQ
jgi:hypothetical protein